MSAAGDDVIRQSLITAAGTELRTSFYFKLPCAHPIQEPVVQPAAVVTATPATVVRGMPADFVQPQEITGLEVAQAQAAAVTHEGLAARANSLETM